MINIDIEIYYEEDSEISNEDEINLHRFREELDRLSSNYDRVEYLKKLLEDGSFSIGNFYCEP